MSASLSTTKPAAAALRQRRPRGEASRQAILEATLELIAREGIHAVTHRAIAATGGMALASTTYFFASLQQLLLQAFELYVEQASPANRQVLEHAAALVRKGGTSATARRRLRTALEDLLVDFMRSELREHARGLAVEVQYLSLVRPDAALAARIVGYRDALVEGIAAVLAPLPGVQPLQDASLLLGAIHRLEFEGLRASGVIPEERVRAELRRLLGLILGLPSSPPRPGR